MLSSDLWFIVLSFGLVAVLGLFVRLCAWISGIDPDAGSRGGVR